MKLRLFTDPHLGLNRTSHTTPGSRALLRQALGNQVDQIMQDPGHGVLCLGDLFDTYNADNLTLLEGMNTYRKCHIVLHGNHDLANRTDVISSIELISLLSSTPATRYEANEPKASTFSIGLPFWWVDHKFTQTLFEQALEDAFAQATTNSVLLLHCNYESPFATQESSLNLTREMATHLLTKFSQIFIGHEHVSRSDLSGKVVLLGNTHPTGFSDISDKYYWDLEINNGRLEKVTPSLIWEKETGYLSIPWQELSELVAIGSKVQFIDVTGIADQQHMPIISKQISDLWNLSPNLLMVRNNVSSASSTKDVELQEAVRCQSVPERISSDLADHRLGPVWSQYLSRL